MVNQDSVKAVRGLLSSTRETDHFSLYYLSPKVRHQGIGAHAVLTEQIIDAYVDGLEESYDILASPPFARRPPMVDDTGRTPVLICDTLALVTDGNPFASISGTGVPYIVLPARGNSPDFQLKLQLAKGQAAHEATHVFNFRERPLEDEHTASWAWLDEGLAMLVEASVIKSSQTALQFALDWVVRPEVPVDVPRAWYCAGLFAAYLSEKLGADFLSKVWMNADREETALGALQRKAAERGRVLVDSSPTVHDLFGSGYCVDSYFPESCQNGGYIHSVIQRFGKRVVCSSHDLEQGANEPIAERVDHLACRYHRLHPRAGGGPCTIRARVPERNGSMLLKIHAVVVRDGERGESRVLEPASGNGDPEYFQLETRFSEDCLTDRDHLLVVVANCGTRGSRDYRHVVNPSNDDRIPYEIQLTHE